MPLPQELQQSIEAILSSLYHAQSPPDAGKRYYSLIFRDLPSRHDYPDYYLFIKEPRSLNGIAESLRQGRYSSPQAVAYDLFLIWSNAREYNEQGSQVYEDADTLEHYMSQLWQQRTPPLPPFESLPRPGSLPFTAAAAPEPERKVKRLKLTGASLGTASATSSATPPASRPSTKIRINPPAPAPAPPSASSASPAPSTPAITLKLGGKTAATTAPPAPSAPAAQYPAGPQQLPALPDTVASTSAQVSPDAGDTAGRDARKRAREEERSSSAAPKKEPKKKGKEVDADGDGEGEEGHSGPPIVTIPDVESGWMTDELGQQPTQVYLDILNKIRSHTDATGRQLATPLLELPDRATRPDYYQRISDPVALSTIESKVNAGAYPSAEAFDRDLHHLFDIAKVLNRPETSGTVYSDLIVLQRLYQELTKRVSPVARGAEIRDAATLSSAAGGPGSVKREDGMAPSDESKVGRATTRPTTKDKILLDGINFKGEVLRVGDWIHLLNSANPAKPIIAQIWQTYKRPDSPQRCLSVCWYYRPEETVHPASRTFYENEVFKTGIFIDHVVEEYVGRCFVMFFTKYTRGRPKPPAWTPSIPLYVCEYRYKDDVKAFKKIKSWNSCVPEQVRNNEYEFEPYDDDHVDSLAKVKSPFVRGVAGPGGLDGDASGGGAAQPSYHFLQDGVPATAEEVQAQQAADVDAQVVADLARVLDDPLAGSGAGTSLYNVQAALDLGAAASFLSSPSAFEASAAANAFATAPQAQASSQSEPPLATSDFFTPLPSSLKSKFRNDALGDLLWFGAPAATVPTLSKPTHSLAYLYWRVTQAQAQAQAQVAAARHGA
ncbi:hypothetical protein JCM21900_006450 [Sporobolomyces salmonicolor]